MNIVFLHIGELQDALHMWYGWDLTNVPHSCICDSINHAMTCNRGGSPPLMWHNDIRNIIAKLLQEVCHTVATESLPQLLSGESFHHPLANVSNEAHLDIKACRVWNTTLVAFLMLGFITQMLQAIVPKTSPLCSDNMSQPIQWKDTWSGTWCLYHWFLLLWLHGREATTSYKCLADMLVLRQGKPYPIVMGFSVSIDLLRVHAETIDHFYTCSMFVVFICACFL